MGSVCLAGEGRAVAGLDPRDVVVGAPRVVGGGRQGTGGTWGGGGLAKINDWKNILI